MDDNFKRLQRDIKKLDSYRVITTDELSAFLNDVANVLAQYRSATSQINKETKDTLNSLVQAIDNAHSQIIAKQEGKLSTAVTREIYKIEQVIAECKKIKDEIITMKPKDGAKGDKGDKGDTGETGADGKDGKDGSPDTSEQVRDKLESLKDEERLDASAIKGLEKFIKTTKEIVNGGVRLLTGLMDVNISSPTNGQALVYDSTLKLWKNGTVSGSGGIAVTVSATDPVGVANDGDIHLLTDDGTVGGTVIKTFIYDTAWVDMTEPDYEKCKNVTGSTITKGKIVYVNGANGSLPTITLADNTTETTSSKTIGITAKSITNNSDGYFIRSGLLIGIDTSTFAAGDTLWLGTSGNFTNTRPTAPNHAVFVGYALTSSANGRVLVSIMNGYELDELHNVSITTPLNNQVLAYESATGLWKNATMSGSGTPGGSDTQVQFNDGGSFGGDTAFTWNKIDNALNIGLESIGGAIVGRDATTADTNGGGLNLTAGTGKGTGTGGYLYLSAGYNEAYSALGELSLGGLNGNAILEMSSLSANRTFTFPNQTGTLALASQSTDYEVTDNTKGLILKSADGTRWRIGITNNGELTAVSL